MSWFMLILVVLVLGCTQEAPSPPFPPPPEDLGAWVVPELVQPSALTPQPGPAVEEKPTTAEKVYP